MRVLVAEDLYLLRDGLVRLMRDYGHTVIATTRDGPSTALALIEHAPDVSIIDVRMPPTQTDEGLRAALAGRQHLPGLPILILSQHVEQLYARELLADRSGGVGYLLKERVVDADQFVEALERVAAGGTALDPAVVAALIGGQPRTSPLAALTERERSVLALMAEGLSNPAVARRLHLSEGAISKHTTTIFAKLGIRAHDDSNRRVLAVLTYLSQAD
ncbi:response regulator transcription factor [Micromonospora sp. NPDC049559]|uniref:response regulator transcription factor n=1 Tax=Micromonospora sp. NPDC049559 TaxID=3155923 RepID=UPI00343C60BA